MDIEIQSRVANGIDIRGASHVCSRSHQKDLPVINAFVNGLAQSTVVTADN
jgi:hypothetical protein